MAGYSSQRSDTCQLGARPSRPRTESATLNSVAPARKGTCFVTARTRCGPGRHRSSIYLGQRAAVSGTQTGSGCGIGKIRQTICRRTAGQSAFDLAIDSGQFEIVQLLIVENRAKLNASQLTRIAKLLVKNQRLECLKQLIPPVNDTQGIDLTLPRFSSLVPGHSISRAVDNAHCIGISKLPLLAAP